MKRNPNLTIDPNLPDWAAEILRASRAVTPLKTRVQRELPHLRPRAFKPRLRWICKTWWRRLTRHHLCHRHPEPNTPTLSLLLLTPNSPHIGIIPNELYPQPRVRRTKAIQALDSPIPAWQAIRFPDL